MYANRLEQNGIVLRRMDAHLAIMFSQRPLRNFSAHSAVSFSRGFRNSRYSDMKQSLHQDRSSQCGEKGHRHSDHADSQEVPETDIQLLAA